MTGVCGTANLALVRSLGATTVVDYAREDFTAQGQRCDLIFDAVDKNRSAAGLSHSIGQWPLAASVSRSTMEDRSSSPRA